jgi:putative peptidoglycan lipid II flippase
VDNERQQPPPSEQRLPERQEYYGWQYDQDQPAEMPQQSPAQPPSPLYLPPPPSSQPPGYPQPQQPPVYPPQPPQNRQPQQPQQPPQESRWRPQYQQPIHDMGTSLGYGQGMEYQYFDPPQPSQPIARLRQERLQQLREERMRRQQRRMKSDITVSIPWKGQRGRQPSRPLQPPQAPMQASPILSLSPGEVSPTLSGNLPPYAAPEQMQPAAASAQDTGMIQRVRIARASLILTGAFVASRVLGLMRSSMFAFVFGTTATSDAYVQAFLVPDMIFNIVAGGALSSAFIPVFTNYMVGERDEKTAWHIASSALNLALSVMVALSLIAIIFAPQIVPLYNPGIHDPKELALIVSLSRIMFLQSLILGSGVIVQAVLNARQDFRLPAIGTVLYNVGLIAGLLPGVYFALHGQRNDQVAVYYATWGVVLGAFLQVIIQVPGLRKVGMHYSLSFDWHHPGIIQMARQMVPRIINSVMLFFSTFVDRALIELLGAWIILSHLGTQQVVDGLITQYNQAFQLVLLPLGIFGMAVATAAFPTMAENVARGRLDRARGTILETLRSILFLSIPSSIGLMVLALPVIQALFQHGRFSLTDARSTAVPLTFFALGLAGLVAVEILTRSFYALRDSKTPVIVSIGQFAFKIALSLLLVNLAVFGPQWGTGALAFSTSIAGLLEAAVLFWLLHQKVGELQPRMIVHFIGRVLVAAIVMGLGLVIVRFLLDMVIVTTQSQTLGIGGALLAIIKVIIEIFIGLVIYLRVARMLGIEELGPVRRVLDRLKLSWI